MKRIPAEGLLGLAVLGLIAILIIPLPPLLLDVLLAAQIGASLLVLLVGLSIRRPLDFSVFPSLLLIVTLFRLGLNVSSTRLILLHGADGPEAVSRIVDAFGRFAAGGSLVVGAVVFLVLIVINFVVITKGSGRVAEVAARFTLDALPGKQMSIDADLAAGLLDEAGARKRREELERETEFFGAMDGASKFVRGDAIAGLVITGINIVGGLLVGTAGEGLSFSDAAKTYTILTMGDGLVSQIPALLVSVAAGIVVTRAGGTDLSTQLGSELMERPVVLASAAAALAALSLLPGMPFVVFILLAAAAALLARRALRRREARVRAPREKKQPEEERIEDLLALDTVEIDVGYGLLPLIDVSKGGELPGRVTSLRKQLASDLGIILPPVHLRDDLRLDPHAYRIKIRGMEVGKGTAYADRLMVLDASGKKPEIEGLSETEPTFGLPCVWIDPALRVAAEAKGLTVIDPASVLTTHLSEVLSTHAHEIVGRQEVQELLALLQKDAPKLVEEVVPGAVSLGTLVSVVRRLLEERISVRDLRSILEAVADAAPKSKEVHYLVEQVRRRLFRRITERVATDGVVHAITLSRRAEEVLRSALGQQDGEPVLALDLDSARALIDHVQSHASALATAGHAPVLLAPPDLRRPIFVFLSRFVPEIYVISAQELVPGVSIEVAGTVDLGQARSSPGWAGVSSTPAAAPA
ncbi:MAG: flagellar biosynthesis protein FlhA [Deltaproteobacteria bacterium]|nr:MAG: flagellar biosynthesis protein FlhA [Deltaproteobacteria bacterium]